MKTITLLAVMAMLLVALSGSTSSVGGPMTFMLVVFLVMLAVGIYEAGIEKPQRCLDRIVNIIVSVIGGFVAVSFAGMAMEMMLHAVFTSKGR